MHTRGMTWFNVSALCGALFLAGCDSLVMPDFTSSGILAAPATPTATPNPTATPAPTPTPIPAIAYVSGMGSRSGSFTVSAPAKSTLIIYVAGDPGHDVSGGGLTWTPVIGPTDFQGSLNMYVAYSASALTSVSISYGSGWDGWIDVFTGVDSTNPIDQVTSFTPGADNPSPAITPTVDNSMVIGVLDDWSDGAMTAGSGFTAGDAYVNDQSGFTMLGIYGNTTATNGQATHANFTWVNGSGVGIIANLRNGL